MNKNKILGILFYIAGLFFVAATIVHYKNGGLSNSIFPILMGGICFGTGSVFLYLSNHN